MTPPNDGQSVPTAKPGDASLIRVAVFTNLLPSYRLDLYRRLLADPRISVTVYTERPRGRTSFSRVDHLLGDSTRPVRHIRLFGGRFVLHLYPPDSLRADVFVVDGNLRHLVQAGYAALLRAAGKPVVIWSSATHARVAPLGARLRMRYWRFFRNFLMYTPQDCRVLREAGLRPAVLASINNGLDQVNIDVHAAEWPQERLTAFLRQRGWLGRQIVVSSGRLDEPRLAPFADILPDVVATVPKLLWVVIGDGAHRPAMAAAIAARGLSEYVHFAGAIYDEAALAPLMRSAEVFVYPHAIGLSINHAFGYGLPVVTHDRAELQGPEFSILEHGVNGFAYPYGDHAALASTVTRLLTEPGLAADMGAAGLEVVRHQFNTAVMAKRFREVVQAAYVAD